MHQALTLISSANEAPAPMNRRSRIAPERGAYDDIQVDLTNLIFSRLSPIVLSGTLGLIFTTALLAQSYRDPVLWILLWIDVVVCGARMGIVLTYRRREGKEISILEAKRWEIVYGIATVLYAGLVAAGTARVFWKHDMAGAMLCAMGSLAVCSGIAARLGLRPWIMKAAGMVLLVTLFVSSIAFGQTLIVVGGAMVGLYSITFLGSADRNFAAVVEQLRGKQALIQLSQQDSLTLLCNRRQFRTRLAEACQSGLSFAVLFLDLDDFKAVNDSLGHAAGDELLRHVAGRLRAVMRESDLLARLGGDEFAILQYPAAGEKDAESLAERINARIAAPFRIQGKHASIGISIGIRLSKGRGQDPDMLLNKADSALYSAKARGKGSFHLAAD